MRNKLSRLLIIGLVLSGVFILPTAADVYIGTDQYGNPSIYCDAEDLIRYHEQSTWTGINSYYKPPSASRYFSVPSIPENTDNISRTILSTPPSKVPLIGGYIPTKQSGRFSKYIP